MSPRLQPDYSSLEAVRLLGCQRKTNTEKAKNDRKYPCHH